MPRTFFACLLDKLFTERVIYPSDVYHMGTYRTVRGPLFSPRPTVSITILIYTFLWWGVQSKLALYKSTKIQILGCLTTKDNKNSWEVFFQFLPCLFFLFFGRANQQVWVSMWYFIISYKFTLHQLGWPWTLKSTNKTGTNFPKTRVLNLIALIYISKIQQLNTTYHH